MRFSACSKGSRGSLAMISTREQSVFKDQKPNRRQQLTTTRNVKFFGKGQISRGGVARRKRVNSLFFLYLQIISEDDVIGIWIAMIRVSIPDVQESWE
jgi:hypothetical protein